MFLLFICGPVLSFFDFSLVSFHLFTGQVDGKGGCSFQSHSVLYVRCVTHDEGKVECSERP